MNAENNNSFYPPEFHQGQDDKDGEIRLSFESAHRLAGVQHLPEHPSSSSSSTFITTANTAMFSLSSLTGSNNSNATSAVDSSSALAESGSLRRQAKKVQEAQEMVVDNDRTSTFGAGPTTLDSDSPRRPSMQMTLNFRRSSQALRQQRRSRVDFDCSSSSNNDDEDADDDDGDDYADGRYRERGDVDEGDDSDADGDGDDDPDADVDMVPNRRRDGSVRSEIFPTATDPSSTTTAAVHRSSSFSSILASPASLLSLASTNTATAFTDHPSTSTTLAGSIVDPSAMLAPLGDNSARGSVSPFHSHSQLPSISHPSTTNHHHHQLVIQRQQQSHDPYSSEYQQLHNDNNDHHASSHPRAHQLIGLLTDASQGTTTPTGSLLSTSTTSSSSSSSSTPAESQVKNVESPFDRREQNAAVGRRTQQSSIESSLSPYPRDYSPVDSRRRPTWSIPSPPAKSRSLLDSKSRPHYDQDFSVHLPHPSTLSPLTTASTLSSYTSSHPSSPYDTSSTAVAAAAAAFKHISPLSASSWSPPAFYYPTSAPLGRRESPTSRAGLSSSPHTTDLHWDARSDSNQRPDKRLHLLYPAQQSILTTTPNTTNNNSMPSMTTMTEDRLSLHRLSPPEDMNEHSSSNNSNKNSKDRSLYPIPTDRPFHDNLWLHRRHPATAEGSSSDRSRVSTVESGSHVPPPLQRTHHTASMGQDHPFDPEMSTSSNSYTGNNNTPSSSSSSLLKSPSKKWTSTESIFQRKVLSARGTPKGPLPMNVQINLLSSVLRHDPFNCPIRRTTQVWEIISREQGVRARTCARRYDNIIQASIAGRERPIGTEEQIAIKKKLLDQLFVMMNQPQALVRMQKKKRYRSEEADRQLLQETIRLNPFAQKMGQVAKAWEDVRDALKMQVHARQCIRRVNRMIKPYQLRERMYHGNIPDEMKEENDELIKQVIQMMQASGQGGPLEEDDEEDAEDDSASDSDDQEDSNQGRSRRRSDSNGSSKAQGNGGKDNNEIGEEETSTSRRIKSSTAIDVSVSPRSPALSIVQSPQTMATTPAASEPPSLASSEPTTPAQKSNGRPRQSSQSSVGNFGHTSNKRSLVDRTDDEMVAVATPSPRHPFESEFKPQRLWGSHPYSKERSSRMPHGTHLQRVWSPPSVARGQNDPHRPAKYTRSSSSDLLRDSTKDQQDRSMALQSSFHSPTAGGSDSGHYDHQRQHQHQHQHSGHMQARTEAVMDGQVAISSAQQKQQQPVAQLYRAILGEFRAVQRYLGQMEDQRQQDKERQAEMRYLMDKLQYQIHQQQQSIQDLQLQLNQQQQPQSQQQQQQQQPSRTSPPHQQQQQDHRRSPQHYEQHRASQDYSSHSFITSLSSGVDHPPKSLEDQE